MSSLIYIGLFAVGFILGAGAMLLYFQYSIYSQASDIQEQFEKISELQEQQSGKEDEKKKNE